MGHLALALFAILTAYLAVKSAERAGGSYAYLPRAKRLILPWVVWSLFYWVVEAVVTDGPDKFRPLVDPWSLLYGGYIHLWFLPFIGLAMVLVSPAVAFVTTPQRLAGVSALMVALSGPWQPRMGELADFLAMDSTTMTAAIKPLEKRGLVAVVADEADRRIRRPRLTPEGRVLVRQAVPLWTAEHARVAEEAQAPDPLALARMIDALG